MSLFGGNKTQSKQPNKLGSIQIQSQGYGNVIPLVFGRARVALQLFFYDNFMAVPQTDKSGGKGGSKKQVTGYNYSATIMLGVAQGPIYGTGALWVDSTKYIGANSLAFSYINPKDYNLPPSTFVGFQFTGQLLGFTTFGGDQTAPWGYVNTFDHARAVQLRGLAYLAAPNYPLGSSGNLGNHSLEVMGLCCSANDMQANPAHFISYLLIYECGININNIGDTKPYYYYCANNNLWFSFALTTQQQASELVSQFLNLTSSELVVDNGIFSIIPYALAIQTGVNLTSDDFIGDQGSSYLIPTRKRAIDCFNHLKLEFLNRANDYNIQVVEQKDLASIDAIGLRAGDTVQAHCVTDVAIATNLVNHLLYRDLNIRNTYEFTLSIRYIFLALMDVITITDAVLGLFEKPVIIKKIVLGKDYKLKISAEDYVAEAYTVPSHAPAPTQPYIPNQDTAVGNINPPVLFTAPAQLTATGLEIWCAISSSNPMYGGCIIYMSTDGGTSYNRIGSHDGQTRMGTVTANCLSSDMTLAVDLTLSKGILTSVDALSFAALSTLCRAGHEFLAFETATLTAPSQYALTSLSRGLYGSHAGTVAGDSFVRCDSSLFKFAYSAAYQGKTIKLKFQAYNLFQAGLQDLSTLPAYNFTIGGSVWDNGSSIWDGGTSLWDN